LYAQKFPSLCKLKEQNNKLWLAIEDVNSIKRADEIIVQIESLITEANTNPVNNEI
jgi:hypothetical protein